MNPKPVEEIRSPDYPSCESLLADKEVLARNVPRRWRRLPGVAGLVLAAVLPGCGGDAGPPAVAGPSNPASVLVDPTLPFNDSFGDDPFADDDLQSNRPEPVVSEASWWIESLMWGRNRSTFTTGGIMMVQPAPATEDAMPLPTDAPLPPVPDAPVPPLSEAPEPPPSWE